MGLWDAISDSFKDKNPDVSFSFMDAASRIGTAVAVHCFEKLVNTYLPNEELRSNKSELVASVAKDAAFYACREAVKSVSGGLPVHGFLPKSHHHESEPDQKNEEMKALLGKLERMEKALMEVKANEREKELQAKVDRLEKALQARSSNRIIKKDLSSNRSSMLNQLQAHNLSAGLIKAQYAAPQLNQKPGDVIKDFVEKDFMKNFLSSNLKFQGARLRPKSS